MKYAAIKQPDPGQIFWITSAIEDKLEFTDVVNDHGGTQVNWKARENWMTTGEVHAAVMEHRLALPHKSMDWPQVWREIKTKAEQLRGCYDPCKQIMAEQIGTRGHFFGVRYRHEPCGPHSHLAGTCMGCADVQEAAPVVAQTEPCRSHSLWAGTCGGCADVEEAAPVVAQTEPCGPHSHQQHQCGECAEVVCPHGLAKYKCLQPQCCEGPGGGVCVHRHLMPSMCGECAEVVCPHGLAKYKSLQPQCC
jgi:hypothetical protein